MHARVTTYRIKTGTAEAIAEIARAGLLPILQGMPGFVRYGVAAVGDGTVLSISLWSDRANAEAAVVAAADFVATDLADHIVLITNAVGDLIFYEGVPVAV